MFYRRAGIRHLDYRHERQLWPLPFDRLLVGIVVALALAAPFIVDRLYLVAYLLPWLIWSSAALGLNLLMGGAGQIHLGYGAVMAIGAYTGVHLVRFGAPLEIAMLVGGIASAVIGVVFGFFPAQIPGHLAHGRIAIPLVQLADTEKLPLDAVVASAYVISPRHRFDQRLNRLVRGLIGEVAR